MTTETNGRIKLSPQLAIAIVGWALTLMAAWGMVSSRIAVVETKQGENERRLQRIEQKIDDLLRRP